MTRALPSRRRPSRRRAAVAATAAIAVAAVVVPAMASAHQPGRLSVAGASSAAAALVTSSSTTLSRDTFANPPASVRPMYRYWMPLAYTDDDVLREELRDMAAAGAGGVEVAPFVIPGAGNQSNAFLEQSGWGTPLWAHRMEVITDEAAKLGLVVDQNMGPQYPPTVRLLNSFNQPQAEQQLIFGREFDPPGTTRTGALPAPTTAPPSVTTQLCDAALMGDEVLRVQNLGGFGPGDTVTVGTGPTAEQVTVTGLDEQFQGVMRGVAAGKASEGCPESALLTQFEPWRPSWTPIWTPLRPHSM